MFYVAEVSIPPNTLKAAPLRVVLPANVGTVTRVVVRWRWGSADLCGCQIWRGESPVWPSSFVSWFTSHQQVVEFEEDYVIADAPLDFVVLCYNEDDTYAHTLWVGLAVMPLPAEPGLLAGQIVESTPMPLPEE